MKTPYLCTRFRTQSLSIQRQWRDGRVVDYNGLENRRAERHRGFESLSLRNKHWKSMAYKVNTRFYTQECKVGCFYIHLRNHVLVVIIICA